MTASPITFQTGIGTDFAVRPTYNPGMAPAIAWFDARNVADTRADWCRWDFGDAGTPRPDPRHTPRPIEFPTTVDPAHDKLEGPVIAWVYDKPGTYTVGLRIDRANGSVDHFTVQVIVDPDTRTQLYFGPAGSDANTGTDPTKPLLSFAKLQQVLKGSRVHVHLQPGWVGTFTGSIQLTKDIVIEAIAGAGDKPMALAPAGGAAFTGWASVTERCLIRGLQFDAPFKPVINPGGYAWSNAGASAALEARGESIGLVDCDFHNLNRAVVIQGNAGGATDGVLVMGCRQLLPGGISSQVLSVWGAKHVVVLFNQLTNSANESTFRVAADGADGLTVLYNEFTQQIDVPHGRTLAKAASTVRTAKDVLFAFNWVHDAECSFDPMSADAHVADVLIKWNVLTSPAAPASFTLRPNVSGITLRENYMQRTNGPCIGLAPDATLKEPMSDIVIQHNTFVGDGATLMRIYTAGAATTLIPSFVCDATNATREVTASDHIRNRKHDAQTRIQNLGARARLGRGDAGRHRPVARRRGGRSTRRTAGPGHCVGGVLALTGGGEIAGPFGPIGHDDGASPIAGRAVPWPDCEITPYRAGVRPDRFGKPVYVFEFKPAPRGASSSPEFFMDSIETFIASLIVKAVQKSVPTLSADDIAKVNKAVADFTTTAMDLAAVYFVLRNAGATKTTTK